MRSARTSCSSVTSWFVLANEKEILDGKVVVMRSYNTTRIVVLFPRQLACQLSGLN